jgi:LysM repeat protein
MRTWTKSACVVLAWIILSIILVAVGTKGSVHPAQANTRTAGSTEVILTSTLSVVAGSMTATSPTSRFVVHPGDTLSGIAARFAVRGGWPALYAANRHAIGPDPNVIHSGTMLTIPRLAASSPPGPGRALRRQHPPAPPPSLSAGLQHHPRSASKGVLAATGMPRWLKAVLLAVGLLILVAFLAEPVLMGRHRRQQATAQEARKAETTAPATAVQQTAVREAAVHHDTAPALPPSQAGSGPGPGCWRPGTCQARIVLADYDRLVVTRSKPDGTVYVLRPPGEDPKAILRVARLVLPEGPYGELARQLGMPAIGPVE